MNYPNCISFDIYLLLIVCFLFTLCYFISVDLLMSISGNLNLYKLRDMNIVKIVNSSDILLMASNFLFRKEWLSCILMLEFALLEHGSNTQSIEYYTCLSFCFYKLELYNKAEKYCLLYLDYYPKHINSLVSLADIYILLNKHIKAKMMYQKILNIDPANIKAKKYLKLF